MNVLSNLDEGPVTVIVRHKVRKGQEQAFEAWMTGMAHAELKFPGHLGLNVIRPTHADNPEYVVIIRFDTYENLRKWEESDARQTWLNRLRDLVEEESLREKFSGMEFWFTPPPRSPATARPPKYKMAIVTLVALYPLVILVNLALDSLVKDFPFPVKTLVIVTPIVIMMTYAAMPMLTHFLSFWLFPRTLDKPAAPSTLPKQKNG
jgi:antibiotic biosynthesis monooxygenase (ABM) superfamily enzyme